MLKIIHQMKTRDERGFTLIELLIVIAIIAILAAIAIPQFAAYRQRGVRASMQADARNIATVEEAAFSDNQSYTNVSVTYPNSGTIGTQTVRPSSNNTVDVTGASTTYTIVIQNANAGTGSTHYSLNSSGGTPVFY
jgi:prepilin-type N-terminal cleavage/methylation domain-containing protein